jgi:triosephosphate isomerase
MRSPFVAGNWKLNGSRSSASALASAIASGSKSGVETVICPVSLHIADVAQALTGSAVKLGAQNASANESGAYTGEVSATMLSEYGCEFVIIGHSERRTLFAETDLGCAERHAAVQQAGLKPIFCVGESLQERESDQTFKVLERQLDALIEVAGPEALDNAVVAYEPVWAIGTGKTATPDQAQAVHAHLRQYVSGHNAEAADRLQILYGGSVNAGNAADLFANADIDGGLIGGAALKSEDFLAICDAASRSQQS